MKTQDFIQFKASLLMKEAKMILSKADLIRDMVVRVYQNSDLAEIYIQECSRIMDISEQVLQSTLAQLVQKIHRGCKKRKEESEKKAFEVIKSGNPVGTKVDILYRLERKIIEILLLYGNKTEQFEDVMMKSNDDGGIIIEFKIQVYQIRLKIQ
jgi:DNA primase